MLNLFAKKTGGDCLTKKLLRKCLDLLWRCGDLGILLELGFEPAPWSPDKTRRFMKDQLALTQKLIDAGRVKL